MADRMTFEQLFNHMEKYIETPEERWKLVTRVKRGISDPNVVGCYSRDQSYFEGAVDILKNLDDIDFMTLMSGKVCLDELDRVKRCARSECIKIPQFLKNIKSYKDKLRQIGIVNGILRPPPPSPTKKSNSSLMKSSTSTAESILEDSSNSSDISSSDDNPLENMSEEARTEHENLFLKNNRHRSLSTADIKKYITKEIVANTRNTPVTRPKNADNTSTLCTLI